MNGMQLFPMASEADEQRFKVLMEDQWLAKKLDRSRRLKEHAAYVETYLGEIKEQPPGVFIDLGPGAGETLEIARSFGHQAVGIDAQRGFGGMGDSYLEACQIRWRQQKLSVLQLTGGALEWLRSSSSLSLVGQCVAINSRGSWEQIFHEFMEGDPHHIHHQAGRMRWRTNDKLLYRTIERAVKRMAIMLRPGGVLMIHMNGCQNSYDGEKIVRDAAESAGLEPKANVTCLYKWVLPKSGSNDQDGHESLSSASTLVLTDEDVLEGAEDDASFTDP